MYDSQQVWFHWTCHQCIQWLHCCMNMKTNYHKEAIMPSVSAACIHGLWKLFWLSFELLHSDYWEETHPYIPELQFRMMKKAWPHWKKKIYIYGSTLQSHLCQYFCACPHAQACWLTHTHTPPFTKHNLQSGAAWDFLSCRFRRKYVSSCSRWAFMAITWTITVS